MTRAGELDRDVEKNAWKQRGGWLRDAAELEQTRNSAINPDISCRSFPFSKTPKTIKAVGYCSLASTQRNEGDNHREDRGPDLQGPGERE